MLSERQQQFVDQARVAHLATADAQARPHVVPVCFALAGDCVYITVDEKPKRDRNRPLKRIRNIWQNPAVALIVDRYDEDWARLGWIMLRGAAQILEAGAEHERAQALLRERYAQYRTMNIEALPVIAIRIDQVTAWGMTE